MVAIFHAVYQPETRTVLLWAERDELAPARAGRQAKPTYHPFSIPKAGLRGAMVNCLPNAELHVAAHTIWLPTSGKFPQPSPELTAYGFAIPESQEPIKFKSWRVETLELNLSAALDWLLALPGYHHFAPGSDVLFWRKAALYSLSRVAAQQVMPQVQQDDDGLFARWKTERIEPFAALAQAMPPICRAVIDKLDAAAAPSSLLGEFVDGIADCIIRESANTINVSDGLNSKSPGGRWLTALTSDDPHLALRGKQAEQFYNAWKQWTEQSAAAGNSAFRITFRVNAPNESQGMWSLDYLLQATDDPSLLVQAGQIWQGDAVKYLQDRFDNPQERLLAGLGYAARLFPPIEHSLRQRTPQNVALVSTQAHQFLSEAAPLLQASGFNVLLPRWWTAKPAALKAKAKLKSSKTTGKSLLTMDRLVEYDWQLSLGGEVISREEFEALAALKQPLVMVRGQWVALDNTQVEAALKLFDQTSAQMTLTEALQIGLDGQTVDIDGLPVEEVSASGWIKTLLNSLKSPEQIETLETPPALHGELRPYQQRGFSWLAFLRRFGLGACLADDMGLGKTIQTIALLLYERDTLKVKAPALLVCPTSVIGNWRRELLHFAPELQVMTHQGAQRQTDENFVSEALKHDVVLTSYPLLARDREMLSQVEWSTLALDEAQNIKNSSTKQAQAARAMHAENRVALTGTPVENRLTELWSIFNFINPGYLGSEAHFRKQFAGPIERVNDANAAQHLKRLTAPFILRRLKTDKSIITDLPDKMEMKVYCTLTTEQGTLYEAVVKDALEEIELSEGVARRGLVLSMLMRLKQICNHPAQFLKDGNKSSSAVAGRSGKLERLREMLEEVYSVGDRALVFTQFAEMGELLRIYLRDTFHDEPLWLHGATPVKDRETMIQRFQATKGPTIFLLSIKAGGVGLNLTRANHVFHFDRWWNPAVENQATDRAFRIGQQRNVQVHKFICAGTLEEKIDEMIESKKKLADSIVGADESWLTELSTGELRELVSLRSGEVE